MKPVQPHREIQRVAALPRRQWTPERTDLLIERLTDALRTSSGTQTLRPLQAITLAEIAKLRGVISAMPVGSGKTMVSLMAPRMLGAKRPLLLVPAHLRDKTERERHEYRKNWVLPQFLRVESYQTLSRDYKGALFSEHLPDAIIADECHYLKNTGAACTKKVNRYLKQYPSVPFIGLSGTIIKDSLLDVAHLMWWAFGDEKTPLPAPGNFHILWEWSRVIDAKVPFTQRMDPGPLRVLCDSPTESIRSAFRRRLSDTPGVIMTREPGFDLPIEIDSRVVEASPDLLERFRALRETGDRPDGVPLADDMAIWRCARELAWGFYSRWDPDPPQWWSEPRAEWARECRHILKTNRSGLDSEEQLKRALDDGTYENEIASALLTRWRKVEPMFRPNPVAVWLTDEPIKRHVGRIKSGLIWTTRPAIGRKISELFGYPYYGQDGTDEKTGRYIEQHTSGPAALSVRANMSGRNLQHITNENHVLNILSASADYQQLIGRTHRTGQKAESVSVTLYFTCGEDFRAWDMAIRTANACDELIEPQKILLANTETIHEIEQMKKTEQWK